MDLAPTPRDVVLRDGCARILRFGRGARREGGEGLPLLLVPSLINRWYVLDLRRGASLVEALVADGVDAFCLDWGRPEDADRYLTWDDVVAKVERAIRFVARETGSKQIGLLGYCMGGTLAGIAAALVPERVAALVNLVGPFDFARGGALTNMVSPKWFDAESVAAAGNVSALQMQSGFLALRPTLSLAKWVGFADRAHDPAQREAFAALEFWSNDNVAFPAAAYATYIRDLYQENLLVQREHRVRGRRVDLGRITCPVLSIVATRDAICPPTAAAALLEVCSSQDKDIMAIEGGHVGAIVGTHAVNEMYPALTAWLRPRLALAASN